MKSAHDKIAAGLSDAMAMVRDPHPEFTAAMMADLTAMPATAPEETVGGDSGLARSSVHAGAGTVVLGLRRGFSPAPATPRAEGEDRP